MTEQPIFNINESLFQQLVEWQAEMEEINSQETEETPQTTPTLPETKDTPIET